MTINSGAESWNLRYADAEMMWSLEPNMFVVEYLSDLPVGTMLDLGGGEGRNALWFATRGWQAENSDFSSVAVDKFLQRAQRENLSERCVGTVADATQPEACVTGPVDLAVLAYLQLPASKLAQAITVAAQNLREGGTFFGVWHARENLTDGFGGPPMPEMLPTQEELGIAATTAGLTITELRLRDRIVTTDDGPRAAIDVVLLATK
jgi:SAM-dependent methyltransferase